MPVLVWFVIECNYKGDGIGVHICYNKISFIIYVIVFGLPK